MFVVLAVALVVLLASGGSSAGGGGNVEFIATGRKRVDEDGELQEVTEATANATGVSRRILLTIWTIECGELSGPREGLLGDTSLGGGPSIGPGQVYRSTAKAMGLWKPTRADEAAEYAELADRSNYRLLCYWAALVWLEKRRLALADNPSLSGYELIHETAWRYNGKGQPASVYADRWFNQYLVNGGDGTDA